MEIRDQRWIRTIFRLRVRWGESCRSTGETACNFFFFSVLARIPDANSSHWKNVSQGNVSYYFFSVLMGEGEMI